MKWKHPPIIKIYEALGAVADGRVEVSENNAKVFSSTRNKFYKVSYDPKEKSIMANDNGSYWKGYLGYPAIAYLFKVGVLEYKPELGELLKNISWKDINQKFKNDFDKTLDFILKPLTNIERNNLKEFTDKISKDINTMSLGHLGKKTMPPEGY
jgi:hypothetical protein